MKNAPQFIALTPLGKKSKSWFAVTHIEHVGIGVQDNSEIMTSSGNQYAVLESVEGVMEAVTGKPIDRTATPSRETLRHVAQHIYDDVAQLTSGACARKLREVAEWLEKVAENA